jgi:hypothetical protein
LSPTLSLSQENQDIRKEYKRLLSSGWKGVGVGGFGYPFPTDDFIEESMMAKIDHQPCMSLVYMKKGDFLKNDFQFLIQNLETKNHKNHKILLQNYHSEHIDYQETLSEMGYAKKGNNYYCKGDKEITLEYFDKIDQKEFQKHINHSIKTEGIIFTDGPTTFLQSLKTSSFDNCDKLHSPIIFKPSRLKINAGFFSELQMIFGCFSYKDIVKKQNGVSYLVLDEIRSEDIKKFIQHFDLNGGIELLYDMIFDKREQMNARTEFSDTLSRVDLTTEDRVLLKMLKQDLGRHISLTLGQCRS